MQGTEQHKSRFPSEILLNIALGITAIGGISWGLPVSALGALGLGLSEMVLARSGDMTKPASAVSFEKECTRGVEFGLAALAIGLVAGGALKIRIGPEYRLMNEVRRMEENAADPRDAGREAQLERAIFGYMREHEEEMVNQMRRSGVAIVPSLEIEGWAEPTEQLKLRVDDSKTLVAEWLPKPEGPAGIRTPGLR